MPNYDFECPVHGIYEWFYTMAELPEIDLCKVPECGKESRRKYLPSSYSVQSDDLNLNPKLKRDLIHAGIDIRGIDSKAAAMTEMKRQGVEFWDPGISRDARRAREYKAEKRDRERKEHIEKTFKDYGLG